jgi:hypothetical protein
MDERQEIERSCIVCDHDERSLILVAAELLRLCSLPCDEQLFDGLRFLELLRTGAARLCRAVAPIGCSYGSSVMNRPLSPSARVGWVNVASFNAV